MPISNVNGNRRGAMRVIQVDSYVDRTAMRYVDLFIREVYEDLVASCIL